jgi:hypothetical protein
VNPRRAAGRSACAGSMARTRSASSIRPSLPRQKNRTTCACLDNVSSSDSYSLLKRNLGVPALTRVVPNIYSCSNSFVTNCLIHSTGETEMMVAKCINVPMDG